MIDTSAMWRSFNRRGAPPTPTGFRQPLHVQSHPEHVTRVSRAETFVETLRRPLRRVDRPDQLHPADTTANIARPLHQRAANPTSATRIATNDYFHYIISPVYFGKAFNTTLLTALA